MIAKKTKSALAQKFNLLVDEPLKNYTSFKIGGPADFLALPKSKTELIRLLKEADHHDMPVTLFGGGTNLLIGDKGIRGLVVITKHLKSTIRIIDKKRAKTTLYTESGERLSKVCQFAINHSLSGLEFSAGIPGSIGGAIKMNAGTLSGDMSTIVETIEVLNQETFKVKTLHRQSLDFSYRKLHQKGFIVAATLKLTFEDPEKIKHIFKQNLAKRNATQPVSFASAGCFFKNPTQGKPAGELIEKSGLKGMRVNDAMVSDIHANYIVNINNATCEDILLLKQKVQEAVSQKYHINLETEVRMEGE
ncbi:MAG: UDP-N-acetylmuramate dehydrogenase [Desulfobacteraceae bacterium]|nr:UDP-N-acetylmuramate dehydrogenase [Desulfobacteraceae bacterium]